MYASVPPRDCQDDKERGKDDFAADFLYLRAERPQRTWSLSSVIGLAAVALLLGFGISSFCHRPPHHGAFGEVECLLALGGGAAGRGGGFDVAMVKSDKCKHVLHAYLRGAYWHDFHVAADQAMEYFKAAAPSPNATVVFDIDETALSNIDEFKHSTKGGKHPGKPLQHDAPPLLAPPLLPILDIYRFLYAANYTVTFITGRGESQRAHTVANLATAGYGQQCPVANGRPVRTPEPCYLQLDLRTPNDTRLASVYKPDRRGQLMARGYNIVGSFGDQFSDLAGENSAVASFKLPNPMYYIL